jgi:hypothetical protein
MKIKIADENPDAAGLIPPAQPDNSGVGVNYADAYIKPLNVELENGMKLTCKRKGLKIMLALDDKKGEALLRKREHGPDIPQILNHALTEAAKSIDAGFSAENGALYIEV